MAVDCDVDLPDILARYGIRLMRVGKSYRCSCPLHGGDNPQAFSVYQSRSGRWRWHCFSGDCGDGDAIEFVRRYHGVGYYEALQMLGVQPPAAPSEPRAPQPPPPVEPPSAQWQSAAGRLVEQSAQSLWSPAGQAARDYLHRRGLTDDLIRRAGLGYNPTARRIRGEVFGIEGENLYFAAGIVIPYWADGALWRVQVRRLSNAEPRYLTLAGSSGTPPYLIAPVTAKPLALVEGPFDVLAVMQAAGDLVTAAGVGATGGRAVRWIARFAVAPIALISLDSDETGDAAADYWCDALQPAAMRWRPTLHDPAEMLEYGGVDLVRSWIEEAIRT